MSLPAPGKLRMAVALVLPVVAALLGRAGPGPRAERFRSGSLFSVPVSRFGQHRPPPLLLLSLHFLPLPPARSPGWLWGGNGVGPAHLPGPTVTTEALSQELAGRYGSYWPHVAI